MEWNLWNVLSAICVFKNVGERFMAKNCCPVGLFVFSKVFGNIRLFDHLEVCDLFFLISIMV